MEPERGSRRGDAVTSRRARGIIAGQWPSLLIIALVAGIFLPRRARGLIARQRIRPRALTLRLVVSIVIGLALLAVASLHPSSLAADVLGLAAGAALAWWGVRLTTFEQTENGLYYTPNRYIGLGVFALFLGRLLYRVGGMVIAGGADVVASPAASAAFSYTSDPITAAALAVAIGYYVVYFGALLARHRRIAAEA